MRAEELQSPEFWLQRWQDCRLPALAATGQHLRSLLPRVEQVRPHLLSEAVVRDALFTLHAVRGINSMPRGRHAAPVLDIGNIILLLGPRRFVEEFAGADTVEQRLAQDARRRERYLLLLRRARLSAALAQEWGKLRLDVKVEELFLAGLLYPLREWLILMDDELQQADATLRQTAEAWLLSREAMPLFGRLLQQWNLPDHFIDLLLEDRQQSSRAQCVYLAAQLAQRLEEGWYADPVLDLLTQTAVLLKTELDALWVLVRQCLLREARQHPVPGVAPLAAMLPLQPPPPPPPAVAAPVVAPRPAPEAEDSLPEKGVLVLRTLPADTAFARVLAMALQVMQRNFGLSRIALLTPEGRRLRVRQCVGDDNWKQLDIALDGQLLFARLLGKSQTLWLHGDNRQRLQSLLSADENRLLGQEPWFALSLVRGGQPIALIIAARSRGGTVLDTPLYLSFQRLAQEVIRRLG